MLHHKKLPIPHMVIHLRGSEAMGEEGAGMQLKVQGRMLRQNRPHSDIQSISLHHKLTGRVRMNQDRSHGEAVFKVPECPVRRRGPRELNLGSGEGIQGEAKLL
jgi:hypothetical protein